MTSFRVPIRGMVDDDESFIYHSWLKSFRDAPAVSGLSDAVYFRSQSALIDRLLKASKVVVAVSPYDDVVIRGWAVGEPERATLHYVYVRSQGLHRRKGVATSLLDAIGEVKYYTHVREPAGSWMRRIGMEYDPRLFGATRQERSKHVSPTSQG